MAYSPNQAYISLSISAPISITQESSGTKQTFKIFAKSEKELPVGGSNSGFMRDRHVY